MTNIIQFPKKEAKKSEEAPPSFVHPKHRLVLAYKQLADSLNFEMTSELQRFFDTAYDLGTNDGYDNGYKDGFNDGLDSR